MSSGPTHLLNQCLQCGMKFDTSEQLANHVKKFCVGSVYGDPEKLEKKYQENLKMKNDPFSKVDIKENNKTNGAYDSLGPKKYEEEFKKQYDIAIQSRETEMQQELHRIKQEKADLRMKKQKEEEQLADLLREVELKKERELRARIEKEQIKKELVALEKNKLNALENDKKSHLEKLAAEREILRQKEDHLINELSKLESDMKTLERIRQEDMEKVNNEAELIKGKGRENKTINDALMQERSERIAELKMRREQLDFERQRIMTDLDKIRKGEPLGVKRSNYGLYAANQMLNEINGIKSYGIDNAREKLYKEQDRINQLKKEQSEIVRKEHIYPEYEHVSPPSYQNPLDKEIRALGNRSFQYGSATQSQDLNLYGGGNMIRNPSYGGIKNSLIANGNAIITNSGNNFYKQHNLDVKKADVLDEISSMRNKYLSGGGNDPNFLKNLENMEIFYKNLKPSYESQIPSEIKKLIDEREEENKKLKEQLELLKLRDEKLNSETPGNFALGDINLKLNGMNPHNENMFNIYQNSKEFFVQNDVRSVDLSEEERVLVSLAAQEVDALRILSQLPVGTELYRFKMEQYKELSMTRAEIEKIVQEQRLQKLRREFEKKRREEDRKYENERWVDEQRKNIIGNRLRRDLQQNKTEEQKYDPTEGFIIHWDYCLGIPKRNDSCQLVYGIYINGDEVYAPRLIDPHPCEIDTSITNRCIYGESHHVLDIPANSNALLIFEIQIFPNKDNPQPKLVSYGWTQLDLFDARRELRRGKFKVPLYECPTDPNIDLDGIKYLNPVQNGVSWMYLRISYPTNDEFAKSQSIYPENTHMEYVIPQIHLRSFRPPIEAQFERPREEYIPQPQMQPSRRFTPLQQQPQQPSYYQNPPYYPPTQEQYPQILPQEPSFHQDNTQSPPQYLNIPQINNQPKPKPKPEVIEQPPPKLEPSIIKEPSVHEPYIKKGLSVIIHAIRNHVARSHLKVACGLLEDGIIVIDENGQNCAYNTSVHNPLDFTKKEVSAISAKSGMSNKAQGQDIIFKEEHKFLRDVNKMLIVSKGKKDIYLSIQVLEKPEPVKIQTDGQSISYKASETANYGGMEYELFGWFLFKLNKSEGGINTGKFIRKLFSPPLIRPPIQADRIPVLESEIEFSIEEFIFDKEDLNEPYGGEDEEGSRKKSKKVKKGKTPAPTKPETSISMNKTVDKSKKEEQQLNWSPYIPNTKPQYADRTFEKGMGVDFYVDGCRFLPDNVTVVKVAVMIVNIDFETIKSAEANIPELDGPTYNPVFNFRMEIRPQYFSPTAMAFISIDTIDKASNQVKIVGYSAINLFINRFSKKQPVSNNDTDIVLLSGNYQLPIFCQEPFRTKPFNMDKIYELERLPTASILVRIHQAPLSADGLRVLNLVDVPNKKDWEAMKVWIPRPLYATGAYNTSLCPIRDSEKELFILRQARDDRPIRETAQLLLGALNINREYSDKELVMFLNAQIKRTSNTGLIDLLYFARYRQEAGFKFALDGIHNAPKAEPYVGLYMLNPPAGLYLYEGDTPDVSKVQLNSLLDWDGPLYSPRFLDGYITFKDIKLDKNTHIIIDIRTVNLKKYPPQFQTVGWTIFPIFTPDGFVKSGIYQVPLIAGEVDREFIKEAPNNDPWTFLLDEMKKKKKLKWLGTSSAMVRLVDSQREGHFNVPWDYNRVDYQYLPKNKLQQYAYNNTADAKAKAGKRLSSIVPNKGNPQAENHKITEAFIQELGLTQYQAQNAS